MNPWRFLPWILCVWVQLVICSLEDDEQASKRYESRRSDSPFLWSVGVELVNDNTLRFDWMNLTSATAEVQHFELNAYTERDLWGVQYTKTINSTARVGYLGDLLPGRNYEIVFAAMYADRRSFVDAGMQSTPTQVPSEVRNLRVAHATSNSLNVAWDRPLQIGGVLDDYLMIIQYDKNDGQKVTRTSQISPVRTKISVLNLPDACEVEIRMQARARSSSPGEKSIAGRRSEVLRVKTFADPVNLNWTVNVFPVNESTLGFKWSPSLSGAEELQRIELKSSAVIDGLKMDHTETVESTARKGFLGGLHPGRSYDTVFVAVYLNRSIEMYAGSHSTKDHAPSKVRDLQGKAATSNSVSLTWSPPLQPGGELGEYRISLTYNKIGSILTEYQRISAKRTTYEASGLPVDCDIYVKVQARRKSQMADAGLLEGNWSEVLHLKTFADPTHSNWTVDVVTVNQSTLQFEWSPPLSGVDEILHIEMKATTTIDGREANFKNVFGPTARKGFLGGLLPGRTYDTLLVVEYSNRSTEMYTGRHSTKPPSPSTVRNFRTGVVTPCSIGLMWDPPLQPDGYLDWYVLNVQYENTDGSNVEALKYIQPELTAYVIDQLPADREIRVEIQSNTKSTLSNEENLADQWSETIRVRTLAEPLNLLSVDIVPIYNNSLHFNWTNWIFAKDGLLRFELNAIDTSEESPSQYSTNVISSKRTGVLGGLIFGRTYKTRIVAVYGNWRIGKYTGLHAIPSGATYEVHNLAAEAVNSSAIRLTWDPPFDPHADILNYLINLQFTVTNDSESNVSHQFPPGEYTQVIGELPADSEITVKARIISRSRMQPTEGIAGKWSKVLRAKTYAVPNAPLNVTAKPISSTAIKVSWRPPHNIDRKMDHYRIFLSYSGYYGALVSKDITMEPLTNNCVISDLPPATDVEVKIATVVRLEDQDGMAEKGKWCKKIAVTTFSVLSAPLNFTGKAINSTAIQVSWRPPHNTGRKIDHYKLFVWYHAIDFGFDIRYIIIEPLSNDCVVNDLPPATGILVSISAVVRLEDEDGMTEDGMSTEMIDVTTPPEGTKDPKERLHPKRTSRRKSTVAIQ